MQTRHKFCSSFGFLGSRWAPLNSPHKRFVVHLCFISIAGRPRAPKTRCSLARRVSVAKETSQWHQSVSLKMLDKVKKFPGLVSLQTVLESSSRDPVHGPVGDDDFELWDHSQMLRNQQRYKWNHGGVICKPSCIPILFILVLIILVVLLPLLDTQDKLAGRHNSSLVGWICHDECGWGSHDGVRGEQMLPLSASMLIHNRMLHSWPINRRLENKPHELTLKPNRSSLFLAYSWLNRFRRDLFTTRIVLVSCPRLMRGMFL